MDCGPASLKCLLEGFGVPASYGRLREACQTDVDGTSIDTLEEIAVQLGLEAEQIMVPVDHLLLPEAMTLPAMVVVRLPNGFTHFVVVWRVHGRRLLQVMDPATGRRWPTARHFLDTVYVHRLPVPAAGWREWAGTEAFLAPLRRRLADLGLAEGDTSRLVATAVADVRWPALARLDAATRMVGDLVRAGGVKRGAPAASLLKAFLAEAQSGDDALIPAHCWSVRPPAEDGGDTLILKGAVLLRVRGLQWRDAAQEAAAFPRPASPELAAVLDEQPPQPGRELWRMMQAYGRHRPLALLPILLLAAVGITLEALLLRTLLDLDRPSPLLSLDRSGTLAALFLFFLALLLTRLHITGAVLALGRHLEIRLRRLFLDKIPRLRDQYFHSRPASDMAQRSHSIHQLRQLPGLGAELIRLIFTLLLTAVAVIWLSPASTLLVIVAAGLSLGLPLLLQPLLAEQDMRLRTHQGALSRFFLDALLGLVAVRAHSAERTVSREHGNLLGEWAQAARQRLRLLIAAEGVQMLAGYSLAIWLLFNHLARGGEPANVLLLLYWVLNVPALGQEIALVARQIPAQRNITLRLLEPLGAAEDESAPFPGDGNQPGQPGGVRIDIEGVSVVAAGQTILEDIHLSIEPGSHVAIVGPSGAGKSSLVGLLLGWHRPAAGRLLVDNNPLAGERLAQLRRQTAWVDPGVQVWNRSLLENLRYGSDGHFALPIARVIEQAGLVALLQRLPQGFDTLLGEGGGLVSGGEGQRLRLGRAFLRRHVRLAILDEPFRGLDREQRRRLLQRARRLWPRTTLLCITHDVAETQTFARVLLLENGRIVEDGKPDELAQRPYSRYRALLAAEQEIGALWAEDSWRKLWLENGRLREDKAEVS